MHVCVSEPTCQYAQSVWNLKFTVLEALCMSFIYASVCNDNAHTSKLPFCISYTGPICYSVCDDNAHTTIYPSVYPTLVLLGVQSKNFDAYACLCQRTDVPLCAIHLELEIYGLGSIEHVFYLCLSMQRQRTYNSLPFRVSYACLTWCAVQKL